MTHRPTSSTTAIGRRGLLVGTGAAVLAAGVVAAPAADAATPVSGDGTNDHLGPNTSPITTTLASAPTTGSVYRTVCMYDFRPFNPAAQETWGGYGVYSAGTATAMRASLEIPYGALVREVEYYLYNNSGANFYPDTYLYVPGQGTISSIGASAAVPNGTAISATRVAVTQQGPYPLGSRLLVSCSTPTTGKIQINGARVGFFHGAATSGLRDTPFRAYDSRGGAGKIGGGVTRTITLPAAVVPPGTTGIIANITAVGATGSGYLKIWATGGTEPTASAINYGVGAPIANAMTITISAAGQINIKASAPVDVIVDITGTIG